LLLVVGKKAFTLFLELRSLSSFRVVAIRMIRWSFTSNQQQATSNCFSYLSGLGYSIDI